LRQPRGGVRANRSCQLLLLLLALLGAAGASERGDGRSIGSPEVPLDSWVYRALDRLAALDVIDTQFVGLRPWTRLECAGLTMEAARRVAQAPGYEREKRLYLALQREFQVEIEELRTRSDTRLEMRSVYSRVSHIQGTPLQDSFHFGQTIVNDFGRPFGEGTSAITGFESFAVAGRFHFRFRGEYQHGPDFAGYDPAVMAVLAPIDRVPALPSYAHDQVNRFELLDVVGGITHEGWDLTFGKQSLWWGPGRAGPMLFSNNARPMWMMRLSRTTPLRLPPALDWLGPMRIEFFMGKMAGHHFPRAPYLHGQKIVLKPVRDLELGFSRTTVFSGEGRPLTLKLFLKSWFSFDEPSNPTPQNDPGDRRGGFDFNWRLPRLQDTVTVYGDLFTDDDPSPLGWAFHRSGADLGVYLPRLPLKNLDLRLEGVYTDAPGSSFAGGGQFFYTNTFYPDAYVNGRQLLGSWVGRQGIGIQGWSTYWFSPESTLEFGFRRHGVSSSFIPGGGNSLDFSVATRLRVRQDLELNGSVQVERWRFPLLAADAQKNVTTSFQLTYFPRRVFRPGTDRGRAAGASATAVTRPTP
jgi:hypothetical protein